MALEVPHMPYVKQEDKMLGGLLSLHACSGTSLCSKNHGTWGRLQLPEVMGLAIDQIKG